MQTYQSFYFITFDPNERSFSSTKRQYWKNSKCQRLKTMHYLLELALVIWFIHNNLPKRDDIDIKIFSIKKKTQLISQIPFYLQYNLIIFTKEITTIFQIVIQQRDGIFHKFFEIDYGKFFRFVIVRV